MSSRLSSKIHELSNWPNYGVSRDGRVWSKHVRGKHKATTEWTLLKPVTTVYGYKQVNLYKNKQATCVKVHRLILETFKGPCPPGKECLHKDGDKTNNATSNLRWGTSKENHADRIRHGNGLRGSSHGMSKLSETQVRQILTLCEKEFRRAKSPKGSAYLEAW